MKPKYSQTNNIPMGFFYDVRDSITDPEDERIINRNVNTLMAIRRMGEGAATEMLARIGMLMLSDTKDLRKDLKEFDQGILF